MSQAGEGNRVYGLLKVRESCLYACVEAGARLLHGVLQANECCCSVRTTHLLPPTHVGQRGILLRAGASARVPIRPRSFVWVEGAARPSIGPSLASSRLLQCLPVSSAANSLLGFYGHSLLTTEGLF